MPIDLDAKDTQMKPTRLVRIPGSERHSYMFEAYVALAVIGLAQTCCLR